MQFLESFILFRKFKVSIQQYLGLYPVLYLSVMRLIGDRVRREYLVSKSTELVIEGFPRSGNTFAFAAFTLAQSRSVKIAHHHHVPAQIIYAIKNRIPVLVIVRKPDEAALSLVIREPYISIKDALSYYMLFYERIIPYSDNCLVATFEQVIGNFGAVILQLNEKFKTNYDKFENNAENVERCFGLIEEMDMLDTGRSEVKESTVARPSKERAKLKKKLKQSIELPANALLLEEAFEVYWRFLGAS